VRAPDGIGTLVYLSVGTDDVDRAFYLEVHGMTAGTPDGPVHVLRDPGGNEIGLLQQDRPDALVAAYADPSHTNAVR
jgi:hypothetical protein